MTVVILEDAAEDLESGARFCESCAKGVGDYFLDAILSTLWFSSQESIDLFSISSNVIEAISIRRRPEKTETAPCRCSAFAYTCVRGTDAADTRREAIYGLGLAI